jgi:hypothetical protein
MPYRCLIIIVTMLIATANNLHARELDSAEKAIVAEAVTESFKDPAAAQFRWLPVPDKPSVVQEYCGTVNGKNSYGCYVGFEPFIVLLNFKDSKVSGVTPVDIGRPGDDGGIARTCFLKGMDLSRIH